MAAAVAVPLSTIQQNGGVLPPSAISYKSPRHGRSRGASINKNKASPFSRGHSVAEEREAAIAQALVFVLKRSHSKDKESKEGSDTEEGKLTSDAEGWVDLEDVLEHPKVSGLGTDVAEIQRVASSAAAKGRLALRRVDGDDKEDASYEIRRVPKATPAHQETERSSPAELTDITSDQEDLPEFVIFKTSYPNYHLIFTSGSIKKAGGQPFLNFIPAGTNNDADVNIWINLKAAMDAGIKWQRTENGNIVTADELPTKLWEKAVARRGDLGVLFIDGRVRKEVPVGLRGKEAKAKKGKGVLKSREDEGSDSASD